MSFIYSKMGLEPAYSKRYGKTRLVQGLEKNVSNNYSPALPYSGNEFRPGNLPDTVVNFFPQKPYPNGRKEYLYSYCFIEVQMIC